MSRGLLTDEQLHSINAQLESVDDLRTTALSLAPDFLAMNFGPEVQVPISAVCFHDCTETLAQIRYALFEHFAHGLYYREVSAPPDPLVAIFFEKYYLDDAAFRLYAAAEDLANAIIFMLDVKDNQLAPYRKSNRVSQQGIVAAYLVKEHANQPLTEVLVDFGRSEEWIFTMNYRNRWVHEQPPTVAGLGIQYRRRQPWQSSKDGKQRFLAIGSGDEAELDVTALRRPILVAYQHLVGIVRTALQEYFQILEKNGITRDGRSVTVRLRFPSR